MADLAYISEIRNILAQARMKAYQSVNSVMVEAYWLIGKRIVEEEQNGKSVQNMVKHYLRIFLLHSPKNLAKDSPLLI